MGLVGSSVFLAVAVVVPDLALVDALKERQAENERRHATGLESKTRRRRRESLVELVGTNASP